ncbi:PREDICTED: immunoglobulin-binding protein 1 [Dufourea novaeangliae]|uniref:Immunoglobulin-binding protein 1b n=1 Tax=Dufourea novaeangliae TaxID=178035 RepID=A0A154P6F2_DUFNO|nr:PREDICTED: immunoglobulin-binding protein 1 [Dufourea novaeangliae]KZC07447.1 Immunoglobulin-binding protein 1b [Dufourea novaeangliae]
MSDENISGSRSDVADVATLSELFDKAFNLFNELNKTDEPTNSSKIQSDVKRAMNMFEDATRLVSVVDMFSKNESFDEVPTENIKYFLLPAFLGTLATKICNVDDRLHIVNVAEIYFVDFLKRVKAYGLTDVNVPEIKPDQDKEHDSERSRSNAELITSMVSRRNTKLQRYKEKKELESRLETLQKHLSNPNIDDEVKRDYFVTLIKLYINLAIEELGMLETEKPILEHMKNMGKDETMASQSSRKHKPTATKLQPIIITRDEMQKKVYGAGYPSLPVLTVQEFYDQRVKDGDWPDPSKQNNKNCLQDMTSRNENDADREDTKEEHLIETDDPERLEQLRAMDEYKDTHRRGWGNRANRS